MYMLICENQTEPFIPLLKTDLDATILRICQCRNYKGKTKWQVVPLTFQNLEKA